jgi:hypothetical protein
VGLTEKAIEDQRWGQFTALREILEGKAWPGELESTLLSTSHVVARLRRLVDVASLASRHRQLLIEAAAKGGGSAAFRISYDMRELIDQIGWLAKAIQDELPVLRDLVVEVERSSERTI